MNRFLTRKTKKGKKGEHDHKPEIDLATALPSSDDFRTSLIMPGLSTRFSMLREQDDPSSKLGKASDDSVLHPKRQSRLHEFGFVPGGLSDIAEVSSLHGSIRPPFAEERQNSFDSHTTDDGSGSIMSRARPGEGNVLFGGRQKVYKISNTGSTKNLGRVVYEDDIHMSAFQRLRQQEKEQLKQLEMDEPGNEAAALPSEPPSPKDLYSPVSSGLSRRETSSSTNTNTRLSTAATSIASQGANAIPAPSPALPNSAPATSPTTEANRATTKTRRLYDQSLDQHMYDQQSSAMNRLNTIQRTRAPTGQSTPPLLFPQTKSATTLNDRFNRSAPFRTESPTPMGGIPFLNGKDTHSASSSPILSRPQSPPLVSPLASDGEEAQTLNSALQPNDRGKATAMGAFNKPAQAFSEQQYAERMKRLQQEREASAPKVGKPKKPSLRERAELEQRKRTEAGTVERKSSDSEVKLEAPSAFSVFQLAASQMKNATPTGPNPLSKQPGPLPQKVQSSVSQKGATFFTSPGSSDDEEELPKRTMTKSELERRLEGIPTIPANKAGKGALRSRSSSRPSAIEHPALRSRSNSRPAQEHRSPPQSSPNGKLQTGSTDKTSEADVDSPTLGPDNGGLSGLIRQHLRNVSSVSSDYGDANQATMNSLPATTPDPLSFRTRDMSAQRRQPASETDTPAHSSYTHSNPWDLEDINNPYYGEDNSVSTSSPVDGNKPRMQTPNGNLPSSDVRTRNRSATQGDDEPDWEKELRKTHARVGSTETQDEREAFQRDLAQRSRAVQETLRSNANHDHSRSNSPAPSGGLKTALSMLRAKSSRESFATVEHSRAEPTKAMRMLGIGANSANASSTSLVGLGDRFYATDNWRSEEGISQRGPPPRSKPSRVLQQSEEDARREQEQRQQRFRTDDSTHPNGKGRSPSSTRARSSSELSSGRSRSRPGHYRDDLEQAMAEGTGSRQTVYPPNTSPSMSGYVANPTQPLPSDRPSIDSQQGRMRSRSNSRTAGGGYFDQKHLQPIHTGNGPANGAPPRLSPASSSNPGISPAFPVSPRPSPGAPSPSINSFRPQQSPVPPFSANNTPPVSGPNTPVAASFNPAPFGKTGPVRKKSIVKSDISEPIFVSGTSVMDTVDLPAGASLKNGMEPPPPVPPINPMRRRFGFGRSEHNDSSAQPPRAPFMEPTRTASSEALGGQASNPKTKLRKTTSEGKSLHAKAQAQVGASPAVASAPFGGRNGSPPRPINDLPIAQRPMDGAMF